VTPLLVILVHSSVQATFDRHMPMWKRHGHPVLVVCPYTKPVKTDETFWFTGPDGYCCAHTVGRWKWLLKNLVAHTRYSHYHFFEYDSIYLGKEIPEEDGFRGTICHNSDPQFVSPFYPGPPWSMDRETLEKILPSAYGNCHEHGVDDRMLGAWALLAKIQMRNHNSGGFFMNTILPEHYPAMERAITVDGAKWIHGIKSPECLEYVTKKGWVEE